MATGYPPGSSAVAVSIKTSPWVAKCSAVASTGNGSAGQCVEQLNGRIADHEAPHWTAGHRHFQTQLGERGHCGLQC